MWRDIILVIGIALTVILFFGLDARKIATIVKGYGISKVVLVSASITVTLLVIYVGFYLPLRTGSFGNTWGTTMALVWLCFLIWEPMLRPYLSGKPKLTKGVSLIRLYGCLPALVVMLIQSDRPIWYDLSVSGGTFIAGFAMGVFVVWIQKRRREKRESGE